MALANPIGIVVFGIGALIIGLALTFAITLVLERFNVTARERRGRWMLIIAPLALAVVSVVSYELI